MLSLAYRPLALADLDAIHDFIAADSPARALAYVAAIRAHCRTLREHPRLGPAREELGPGIRIHPYQRRVVVAYRILPEVVEIVRVFYGGQEYRNLT